jgi:hypothetical protein
MPEGWLQDGHRITSGLPDRHNLWIPTQSCHDQMYLWAPTPAVAGAALEELLKLRHKSSDIFHVVVVPRLMTPRWRYLFNKVCDFSFVASPRLPFWPTECSNPSGLVLCCHLPMQALGAQASSVVDRNGLGLVEGVEDR